MSNVNQNQIVTTSLNQSALLVKRAQEIAAELKLPFVDRQYKPLADIEKEYSSAGILVVARSKLSVYVDGEEFFFHPGMAKLRIKEIKNGNTDRMIEAMKLSAGDSVLDCTAGLGSDAIVANYVVGPKGSVLGLEANLLMAYVVREGIADYQTDNKSLAQALKNIEVIHADHRHYLKKLPANSVDVVYFDPMFRKPLYKSTALSPLRKLAEYAPLDSLTVSEACRVAKKRVVMKETSGSAEFLRLGFKEIENKNSPVAYGVIEVGGD